LNDVPGSPDATSTYPTREPRRRVWRSHAASLLFGAACLIVLGGLGWYLDASRRNGSGDPGAAGVGHRPNATVAVVTASEADIPIRLDALGTVTPVAMATVRPQVSGVITDIFFREGQLVERGQPLARIDPRPFELALNQAAAQLTRDQAELENARVILERNRTLLAQDSIAKQDVDTQAAAVKELEGTVGSDRAAIDTARLNLTYSKVVAPISGRVGLRPVDVGNYVSTSDTTGVATITQVMPIDVAFTLPADAVPSVQKRVGEGARLTATVLDRSRTTALGTGTFLTLDNEIDTQTGTVRAKARFDNADGLLFPNQFVNVQLQLDTLSHAIVVPAAALRHGPHGDFVYVVAQDNTAHIRAVKAGVSVDDRTSISSGLKAGERVVTEGGDRIVDGSAVHLPGQLPRNEQGVRSQTGAGQRHARRQTGAHQG
jgi:membrane fusion protein, multidrug efflux system